MAHSIESRRNRLGFARQVSEPDHQVGESVVVVQRSASKSNLLISTNRLYNFFNKGNLLKFFLL